jgi:hypothetical protein
MPAVPSLMIHMFGHMSGFASGAEDVFVTAKLFGSYGWGSYG